MSSFAAAREVRSPGPRAETAVHAYAVTLVVAVGAFALALSQLGASLDAPLWMVATLAFIALLAEKQGVRVGPVTETSVSVLPILFAAVVFGPFEAMLVGGCALLPFFARPYTRWVIWTSIRSLAAGVASIVALSLVPDTTSFLGVLLAVAIAASVDAVANVSLSLITVVLRRRASVETIRLLGPLLGGTIPLYTPVLAVLAYAYEVVSPWTVLLFFVPALAAQRLLGLYQEQRRLAEDLAAANETLERASVSFARGLVSALDARDEYTAGHSAAVAVYARDIAARLRLSDAEQQMAHLCGLLHDIGKVGVPAGILEKDAPLTLEERRQMEEHSGIGERILASVEGYAEIANVVRHHHERPDGTGYPDRLQAEDIPVISRIVGVADAYDAMTSRRPYRDAMPTAIARARLAEGAGTQFDAEVVAAFDAVLRDASETYRSGARANFALEAQRHPELATEVAVTAA